VEAKNLTGDRSHVSGRDLTLFDLDRGITSSGRSYLVLEGYWYWYKGLGIHHLKNLQEEKRFVGFPR